MSSPPSSKPPPLFNTSFTVHRATPLHLIHPLTPSYLAVLSKRLRDTLTGDSVRGITVTAVADPALLRAGPLEEVRVEMVAVRELMESDDEEEDNEEDEDEEVAGKMALIIDIQYENASGSAILLPQLSPSFASSLPPPQAADIWVENTTSSFPPSKFLRLPLLLLRLPAPLKPPLTAFLSTTFDTRITSLSLPSPTLLFTLESFLSTTQLTGPLSKDLLLTLSFTLPPPCPGVSPPTCLLRSLDVVVSPEDLPKLLRTGESLPESSSLSKNTLSNDNDNASSRGPFARGFAKFLRDNTGLDVWHRSVKITKVACGGFVLSDGRCKVFAPRGRPPAWAKRVIADLTARAAR